MEPLENTYLCPVVMTLFLKPTRESTWAETPKLSAVWEKYFEANGASGKHIFMSSSDDLVFKTNKGVYMG